MITFHPTVKPNVVAVRQLVEYQDTIQNVTRSYTVTAGMITVYNGKATFDSGLGIHSFTTEEILLLGEKMKDLAKRPVS